MITFVLPEIYGVTSEFLALCEQMPETVVPISPYQDQALTFTDEQQAYAYFMTHVGVEEYARKVIHFIEDHLQNELNQEYKKQKIHLVGFSVGASAIWLMGKQQLPFSVNRAMLFYGSQIRKYLSHTPSFPCKLILPCQETHFDVQILAEQLKALPLVDIHQSEHLHGFMNQRSANFCADGYRYFVKWLNDRLHEN